MSKKKYKDGKPNQKPAIIDFNQEKHSYNVQREKNVQLIPKNLAQEDLVTHLNNEDKRIVFAVGPAGTGKTYLGVKAAIKAFKEKRVKKIVITRPAVSSDEEHGFLPGDLNQKMEPWVAPLMDVFEEYWSPLEIQRMLEQKVIEICPLAYMRGRSFKNCFIIADEMQSSTKNQMKMLLTRIGFGTDMFITGDLDQTERGYEDNGLKEFLHMMEHVNAPSIAITRFERKHVERDPVVEEVLEIYDSFK